MADPIHTDRYGTFSGARPHPAAAATTCRLKTEAAPIARGLLRPQALARVRGNPACMARIRQLA